MLLPSKHRKDEMVSIHFALMPLGKNKKISLTSSHSVKSKIVEQTRHFSLLKVSRLRENKSECHRQGIGPSVGVCLDINTASVVNIRVTFIIMF